MTKADLTRILIDRLGLSKQESAHIIDTLLGTIQETLVSGESVKIPGFGTFNVRDKRTRRGRNPQTGEAVEIAARRVVTFKTSGMMRMKTVQLKLDTEE